MNNTKVCMENWHLPDEIGFNIGKKAFVVVRGSVDICTLPDTWIICYHPNL